MSLLLKIMLVFFTLALFYPIVDEIYLWIKNGRKFIVDKLRLSVAVIIFIVWVIGIGISI